MVEPFTSRSGLQSLRVDGVALHSPYDPAAEARRFVRESLGPAPASTVLVLGEGLGFIGAAVAEAAPEARRVTVCYSAEVARHAAPRADASWSPSAAVGLGEFLRRTIGELDVEGLRVIEWPASARIFPEESRRANLAVRSVVRELNGSCATAASAGRLWLRNAVLNLVSLEAVREGAPCAPQRPVVIAASGPTLGRCLPDLAGVRSGIELWALPSAAAALAAAGLPPDLIVLTDPGHWAMVHLHVASVRCPVLMPLSAARGTWRAAGPVRLLDQGTFIERELLAAVGVEAPLAPPHGTVAATALELALDATGGPVTLAGLDLCSLDSRTHVVPNAFDSMLRLDSGRLSPFDGLAYGRARAGESSSRVLDGTRVRLSRSLDTYAGWFAHRASTAPARIFRLHPSPVELPGAAPIDGPGLTALVASAPAGTPGPRLRPDPRWPAPEERRESARGVLSRWARMLGQGAADAHAGSWVEALGASPGLADLAWHTAARGLLDAKRRQRLGDSSGAQAAVVALLEDARAFVLSLRDRLAAGAAVP